MFVTPLTGRHIDVEDDTETLLANAEAIIGADRLTLRLRAFES